MTRETKIKAWTKDHGADVCGIALPKGIFDVAEVCQSTIRRN